MTVQLHPSETASAPTSGLVEMVNVTEPEYAVLQHLTAAWNAFLQLPAERVEYIVAFQAGCQHLQKQILERGENRSGILVAIPPLDGAASRPVLSVTVEERKRRQDERHLALAKARRARERAENPESVRAKEREKWQKRKARSEAAQATTNQTKRPNHSASPRAQASKPTRTENLKAPSGLSQSERVRWRYHNDPVFREHVKTRNRAYSQKRHSEGIKSRQKPRTPEQRTREHERHRLRMATDPIFAEQQRARKRAFDAKYRNALRALKASKAHSGEVRMRQLRADPIYAAAHAALSPSMTEHHRADIVSDIIMAVLEGQVALADVPKLARSFITAHHRRAETYSTASLDAPIGDCKVTMHNFISEGMWGSVQTDE